MPIVLDDPRNLQVGDPVVYVDEVAVAHDALITAIWNGNDPEKTAQSSMNLTYVSSNPDKNDQYGRQLEREATSVVPQSNQSAHGRYWRLYEPRT